MFRASTPVLTLAAALLVGSLSSAQAETLTLRSGNGPAGGSDALLTFYQGPWDSEFSVPLTPLDFTSAQMGPAAQILTTLNGAWTPTLASDPLAQWVSDNPGGDWSGSTNLYAVPFFVTSAFVASASLDFHFLCDNWVGEYYANVNQGLFLNGTPVAGTIGGNYATETNWLNLPVTGLVNPGPNVLYVLSSDVGGPAGIVFSATLRVNGDGTVDAPEHVQAFQLGEAYPNPFNPATTLSFTMAETGPATLTVHNLAGVEVARPFSGLAQRGDHELAFDASALPSGIYLYTLSTEAGVQSRKMILAK
jgi:hypothetical protein